eukprot:m.169342 g.169342  ORF g.169342 m.169342 type:complete len:1125 (+) comp14493_c0_seq1:148-3522(+)
MSYTRAPPRLPSSSEKVVEVLNQLHAEQDPQAKTQLITQVEDVVIFREKELLDGFIDDVLQCQHDESVEVRLRVVEFIENAVKVDPAIAVRCSDSLAILLQDVKPKVAQRVIQAITNCLVSVFAFAAQHHKQQDAQEAWSACETLQDAVVAMRGSTNTGIKLRVLKLLECMVLIYSYRSRGSQSKRRQDASLDLVVADHPFLKTDKLRERGRTMFSTLIHALQTEQLTSTNATALVSLLANIAGKRPTFMCYVLITLRQISASPPSTIKASALRSLQQCIKIQLLILLKHETSAEFHGEIIPVLESLNVPAHSIEPYDRRIDVRQVKLKDRIALSTKRVQRAAAAAAGGGTPRPQKAKVERPPLKFETLRDNLSHDDLIKLVLYSLTTLPDSLSKKASDSPQTPVAAKAGPPMRKMRGKIDTAISRDEVEGTLLPALPQASADDSNAAVASLSRSASIAAPDTPYGKGGKRKRFEVQPLKMDSQACGNLAAEALVRMLQGMVESVSASLLKTQYLLCAQLVANQVRLNPIEDVVMARDLCTMCVWRLLPVLLDKHIEFVVTWLTCEWASSVDMIAQTVDLEQAGGFALDDTTLTHFNRYDVCALRVTTECKKAKNVQRLTHVLSHAPRVTEQMMVSLQDIAGDPACVETSVESLTELITTRPDCRSKATVILLALTQHPLQKVRTFAIIQCKALVRIDDLEAVRADIEDFAEQAASDLLAQAKDETSKEVPSASLIDQHASLLLAICSCSSARLLGPFFRAFANATPALQTSVIEYLSTNEPALRFTYKSDPDGMAEVLSVHVPGAERLQYLALKICCTSPVRVHIRLQNAAKALFEQSNNYMFLVPTLSMLPYTELVETLPHILLLRTKQDPSTEQIIKDAMDFCLGKPSLPPLTIKPLNFLNELHKVKESGELGLTKWHTAEAIKQCFNRMDIFTPKLCQDLFLQISTPAVLPTHTMLTIMLGLKNLPELAKFVLQHVFKKLLAHKVWEEPHLWKGFQLCVTQLAPDSFRAIVSLPQPQLLQLLQVTKLGPRFHAYSLALPERQKRMLPKSVYVTLQQLVQQQQQAAQQAQLAAQQAQLAAQQAEPAEQQEGTMQGEEDTAAGQGHVDNDDVDDGAQSPPQP